MWLFLIFVAVPMIEIGLFIQVGGFLGLWPTLAIVVLTALVGTTLMRAQGVAALQKVQSTLETEQNPAGPIADGAFILVAGVLLLTPGFFTDSIGLALLVPKIREVLFTVLGKQIKARAQAHAQQTQTQYASDTVLDGDFEVVEDNINSKPGNSGWTNPND